MLIYIGVLLNIITKRIRARFSSPLNLSWNLYSSSLVYIIESKQKKKAMSEKSSSGNHISKDNFTYDVELYEVESVEDKRKCRGKIEYKVKWKNYAHTENTWEPMDHLVEVPELIARYERQHPSTEEERKQESRAPKKKKRGGGGKRKEPEGGHSGRGNTGAGNNRRNGNGKPGVVGGPPLEPMGSPGSSGEVGMGTGAGTGEGSNRSYRSNKSNKSNKSKSSVQISLPPNPEGRLESDIPEKITRAKIQGESIVCTVMWKPRANGEVPQSTQYESSVLKQSHPFMLLEYYESRVRHHNKKRGDIPK